MTNITCSNQARMRSLATDFKALWKVRVERNRTRRKVRVFAELDDHIRRDIGVCELGSVERAGLRTPVHHLGW